MCGLLSDDDGDDDADAPQGDAEGTEGEEQAEPEETEEAQPQEEETEEQGEGEVDDSEIDVESTLKDLAARMSRLSSHIEGIEEDREEMEHKIDEVENQLGQLGNLAEVVSSQYNPFIAESSPANPDWDDVERDMVAGEAAPEPPVEPEGEPDREELALDESALQEATPEEPPEPDEPEEPAPGPEAGDEAPADEGPADDGAAEQGDGAEETPALEQEEGLPPAVDEETFEELGASDSPYPGEDGDGPPDPAELDLSQAPDPTAQEDDAFDRNVLLLEWVGYLLERVGRDGLLDILEYYESLGWLGEATKNRALRVATGLDGPDEPETPNWRGDTDLHERTLVVLERLAGRERPESRLEELQLDLDRIFER